jgi:hypothetical protein
MSFTDNAQDDSQLQPKPPQSAGGEPLTQLARSAYRQLQPPPGGPPSPPQNQPARQIPRDPKTGAYLTPWLRQQQQGGPPNVAARPPLSPVPPGLPPRPINFSPYIASFADRPSGQWGTPPAFARMPQQWEVPGIYRGVGMALAQFGSGSVSPIAGLLAKLSANYQQGYMKGQEFQTKMQRDQMQNAALELEFQQQQELHDYNDIFDEYRARGWDNPDQLTADLEAAAQKYGDQNMLNVLGSKGAGAAYQYLQFRDAKWQDLHHSNKQADKEAEDAKDLKDWGVPTEQTPDQAPPPGAPPGTEPTASAAPPASPRTAPVAPPLGAPPQGHPSAGAPAPQAAQPGQPSQPESQGDRVDALEPYQRAGLEYLRGGTMTGVPKNVQKASIAYADKVLGQMDDLVAQARGGKMSKDQIEDALRQINPAIAGEFADIRDLNTPLPGGMGAINAHPFWRDIESLAASSVPGWRVNDYQVVGEMQRDYTAGTSSRRMQAANNMADAAVPLLKALKDIPEGQTPPVNWIDEIASKKFTGDPKWVRLYNAVQMYVQESQSLASPTGRYFEGDVNRLMHEFNVAQGTKAIRAILATDADAASRRLQTLTDDFENTTRQQYPPHYNPKSTAILHALADLDPDKGFANVPNLPPELQGLGMGAPIAGQAAPGAPPSATPSPGWGTLQ